MGEGRQLMSDFSTWQAIWKQLLSTAARVVDFCTLLWQQETTHAAHGLIVHE